MLPAFADVSFSWFFNLLEVLGADAPLLMIHSGSVPVVCTFRSPGQGLFVNPKGLGVNVARSLTTVFGAVYGSTAMCTLHTSTMEKLRGHFGVLPVGTSVSGSGQRSYGACYMDGSSGRLAIPAHVVRVSIAFGVPEVEALQRSGSSNSIKFNVDLQSEKIMDLIKRHAGADSLEGILEMSKARMAFAVANGQEHRDSIAAHDRGYVVALRHAFGDLLVDLVEVPSREAHRQVYCALIHEMNKLEKVRFKEAVPWDSAEGTMIPAKWASLCSAVHAVKERVLEASTRGGTSGASGPVHTVFAKLRSAHILDSGARVDGSWTLDRALERAKNTGQGGRAQGGGRGDNNSDRAGASDRNNDRAGRQVRQRQRSPPPAERAS